MTVTVTLLDVTPRDASWVVSFLVTDGASVKNVVEQRFTTVDDATIKAAARQLASAATAAKGSSGKVSLAIGQPIDLTPDAAPVLTPEQQGQRDWLQAYQVMLRYQRSVAHGFRAADDAELAAVVKTVQQNFLPAYEALI